MIAKMFIRKAGILLSGVALLSNRRMSTMPAVDKKLQGSENQTNQKVYDVAVIGGGSGGLSFALEARKLGVETVLFDYVKETPHKTKWGIGGTCVNVGCIPKKLIHQSAILGQSIKDAYDYGWDLRVNSREEQGNLPKYFSWQRLIEKINLYIKSLNFGYKNSLSNSGVAYYNGLATMIDANTIMCSSDPGIIQKYVKTGKLPQYDADKQNYHIIKAKKIVIATGTRPTYFNQTQCKGSKLAITSDDIFWMKKAPGDTLVVGGGYVAVQIAGFLTQLGFKVSMMTRGEYLRSFDRDMVALILDDLTNRHVNIIPTSLPTELKKDSAGKIDVSIVDTTNKATSNMKFDTVLFAVGRTANTEELNLKKIGVNINPKNGKIITKPDELDKTNIGNIFALGDIVDGVPELTGTVQKAGRMLARRLAADLGVIKLTEKEYKSLNMDYKDYPTTVFTPLQYSVCGLSEDKAIEKYGEQNIEVFHSRLVPLQEAILDKYDQNGTDTKLRAYMKVITDLKGNVLGIHYTGPNAGQIMQGYALAMRMGLNKKDLDRTVGIHPTIAQEFTNLTITKSSEQNPEKGGC